MTGVLIRLIPLILVILVLQAWWYPTPELVEVETVDWAARSEQAYPPDSAQQHNFARFGGLSDRMMADLRAARRAERVVEPLPAFIDRETDGAILTGGPDDWRPVIEALTEDGEGLVLPQAVPVPLPVRDQVDVTVAAATGPQFLALRRTATANLRSWEDVPSDLLFPLRDWWPVLLGVIVVAFGLSHLASGQSSRPALRVGALTHARAITWTLGLALVGLALMVTPHLYGLGKEDVAGAGGFVGLLLVLTGLVSAGVFVGAVRTLGRVLSGRRRFVRWTYLQSDWLAMIGDTRRDHVERAKALLGIIGVLLVLIGGGFVAFAEDTEAALWTAGVLGAVFVLLLIVAVVAPWLHARALRRGPFEIQIGPDAMCVGQTSHVWRTFMARFDGASVEDGPDPALVVAYSQYTLVGKSLVPVRMPQLVRVPVPAGRETEARQVARDLVDANA